MAIKQEGFIFMSLLLLSLIMSLLALASLSQSRLQSYFARNALESLAIKEQAAQALNQAETKIARQGTGVPIMAHLPNSLNYSDQGGIDIFYIKLKLDSDALKAIWWQRKSDQFNAANIQTFLAKDGKCYRLSVQYKPLSLDFNGKKLLLPQVISKIGKPLLVDSQQLGYADQLYLLDDQAELYKMNLALPFNEWQLVKLARLSDSPILSIPLWAGLSENDEVELYIATHHGIEAWRMGYKVKRLWKASVLNSLDIFLEGKRVWYVKDNTFNQLTIGALDRLTGKALPPPLFVKEPKKTEYTFSPGKRGNYWKLVPDNLKKIETLYFAGTSILLFPPQYEVGRQRLQLLPSLQGETKKSPLQGEPKNPLLYQRRARVDFGFS
jgi:hypothetical protein